MRNLRERRNHDTGMREPSENPPVYFTSPYSLARQLALSVYKEGLNDLFEEEFLCGEEVEIEKAMKEMEEIRLISVERRDVHLTHRRSLTR